MKLWEVDLPGTLSAVLREDETAIAIAEVINPYLRQLAQDIGKALILPNLQHQSEAIIDALSREMYIPWYDYGVELAVKRDLIENSDKVNMYMGTPYAVEQVASAYFGESTVEENREYNGLPYHFRVRTPNIEAVTENHKVFQDVIAYTQNLRSVFDGVVVDQHIPKANIYLGAVVTASILTTIPGGTP